MLALGGERAQLGFELAAVARVAHVEHVAADARVVQAVGGDDVEVAMTTVAVGEPQREVARAGVAPSEGAVERGPVIGGHEVVQAGGGGGARGGGGAGGGGARAPRGRA